jgi:uncharacterized protein YbaA (DUF1428 family)
MPHYVDGYVIPVPKSKIDDYRKMAERAARSGWSTGRSSSANASPTT